MRGEHCFYCGHAPGSHFMCYHIFAASKAARVSRAAPPVKSIVHQQKNIPPRAAVMALSDALLFPNALLPLRIFEPRYRAMLADALSHSRMFCIALLKPATAGSGPAHAFHDVGCLGLIRACVTSPDGTSNLVLQGLARVRFAGFSQWSPYPVAEIRELPSQPGNEIESEALASRVIDLCQQMKIQGVELPNVVERTLKHVDDPEVLSDVVTHTFIRDAGRRQDLLERVVVSERLRLLIRYLSEEMA